MKLFSTLLYIIIFITFLTNPNAVLAEETGFEYPSICTTTGSSCSNMSAQDTIYNSWPSGVGGKEVIMSLSDFGVPNDAIIDEIQVKLRIRSTTGGAGNGQRWRIYASQDGISYPSPEGCDATFGWCHHVARSSFNSVNSSTMIFIHDEHIPLKGSDINSPLFKLKLFTGGSNHLADTDIDVLLVNIKYNLGPLPAPLPTGSYHITKGFVSKITSGTSSQIFQKNVSFVYPGGKLILSSTPDGTGKLNYGDSIQLIKGAGFINFSSINNGCSSPQVNIDPIDITYLFEANLGTSTGFGISLKNSCTVSRIITPIYLVNIAGGVLGEIAPPVPFLELPWDYSTTGKTFDELALNPNSWFDHEYPLQNTPCCTLEVLNYTGKEIEDSYRSHNGYDYGILHGVVLDTPVLAAAAGIATFVAEENSGGAGNVIKIDHGNGYQTWYEHLQPTGLIVSDENGSQLVTAGQVIGSTGKTGNVTGPHIHFSVFKDANENDSFIDDYPLGLVDPLGWEGNYTDPWEEYEDNGRNGTKSYNLFVDRTEPQQTTIPNSGGSLNYNNITVTIPSAAYDDELTLSIKYGPYEKKQSDIKSVNPSFFITALNSFFEEVTEFLDPVEIEVDYSNADLSNINEDTMTIYYYNQETETWESLPTTVNKNDKTVITITPHFTQFALMGELLDDTPPETHFTVNGTEGEPGWFSSDVNVELIAEDKLGGIGVLETIYSLDRSLWEKFTTPIEFFAEGNYEIKYMSYDKAGNEEEIKTLEFNIDKTPPQAFINTNKTTLWPPNGKLIPVIIDGIYTNEENQIGKPIIITDEYGEINYGDVGFGDTIWLKAARKDDDLNGRTYKINVLDKAGNISGNSVDIIVPHDQGN